MNYILRHYPDLDLPNILLSDMSYNTIISSLFCKEFSLLKGVLPFTKDAFIFLLPNRGALVNS